MAGLVTADLGSLATVEFPAGQGILELADGPAIRVSLAGVVTPESPGGVATVDILGLV